MFYAVLQPQLLFSTQSYYTLPEAWSKHVGKTWKNRLCLVTLGSDHGNLGGLGDSVRNLAMCADNLLCHVYSSPPSKGTRPFGFIELDYLTLEAVVQFCKS